VICCFAGNLHNNATLTEPDFYNAVHPCLGFTNSMGSMMQEISGMPERIYSMCVKAVIFTSNSGMGVFLFFLQYKIMFL
jgi:hypothetical protein